VLLPTVMDADMNASAAHKFSRYRGRPECFLHVEDAAIVMRSRAN
jgi:hypothetical protein